MSPCERPWIWACVSTCVWRWSMATSPSATAPPALLRHHYCAPPPRRPMPYGWTLTCPQLGSLSNSKQIWPCQLLEHALKKLTLLSPECCTTSWPTTTCPRTSKIDWGSLPGVEETNRPALWAFLRGTWRKVEISSFAGIWVRRPQSWADKYFGLIPRGRGFISHLCKNIPTDVKPESLKSLIAFEEVLSEENHLMCNTFSFVAIKFSWEWIVQYLLELMNSQYLVFLKTSLTSTVTTNLIYCKICFL